MSKLDIIEKKKKRWDFLHEARKMHEDASEANRDLTKAEEKHFNELMREVEVLNLEIQEAEELEATTERDLEQGNFEVLDPNDWGGAPIFRRARTITKQHGLPGAKTYRGLFYDNEHQPLDNGGFKTFKEFVEVLRSGKYDPRLTGFEKPGIAVVGEKRQFVTTTDYLGGYAVPEEWAAWLVDRSLESEIVRPRATVWQMGAKVRRVPAWAGSSHQAYEGGLQLYGGFTPVWMDEASLQSDQLAEIRQIELVAHKLGLYTSCSSELAADGLDFDAQLSAAIIKAISFTLDYYFLNGAGAEAGQPLGVLNDPALITVTRGAAGIIDYDDIVNMISRLHPSAAGKAIWIANFEAKPSLLTMVDGGGHLIWTPNARDGAPGNLLGFPVVWTEKTPGLGETGDLLLTDLSHYAIGIRKEMALERSNAPGWHQDLQSYRCLMRLDGQGTWEEPITPVQGSTTLSWAIALGVGEES
jgi:HK97 family phage major capsid protein